MHKMIRKTSKVVRMPRKRLRDNLLYESLQYTGNLTDKTSFELTVYDGMRVDELHFETSKDVIKAINPQKTNWLHVSGLADVNAVSSLCKGLGFEVLWIQDILNTRHIAKIEESPELSLTVLDAFTYDENEVLQKEHISIVLGKHFVISFQETKRDHFKDIRKAIVANNAKVCTQTADYLYNLLLSNIADNYLAVLDVQRDRMVELEDALMEFNEDHEETGRLIQAYRKEYLLMRKNIMPLKEEFRELLRLNSDLISKANLIYFKDTYDHLKQVFQLIDNAKESIKSLVDLYMANNDLRMNQIMKRLTVVSTIFIPLTFLAGVWGMNFSNMPELHYQYGYFVAWAIMITVGVLIYLFFRRMKWF